MNVQLARCRQPTVIGRMADELFHVVAESGQVAGNARHAHDGAFRRRVPPRLVVTREDAQMRSPDKVVVIHRKHGVVGVEELGVVDDLDTVRGEVEERAGPELREDRVLGVVDHVVGDNRRHRVAFEGKDTTLEEDEVLVGEQVIRVRHHPASSGLNHPVSHVLGNLIDGVLELFHDGLAFEGFDAETAGRGRRDDKGDDRDGRAHVAEPGVQPYTTRMGSLTERSCDEIDGRKDSVSYSAKVQATQYQRAKASMYRSNPLLRCSRRPAVKKYNVLSRSKS